MVGTYPHDDIHPFRHVTIDTTVDLDLANTRRRSMVDVVDGPADRTWVACRRACRRAVDGPADRTWVACRRACRRAVGGKQCG